jgi:hypothetical protein
MVIGDGTFGLISDQQCAVRQLYDRPHAMETGHDRRELDIRSSAEIEIVVSVAQGKTARFLAQSEKRAWQVCPLANGDDNVFAVSVKLEVQVWSRDRILSQRKPRFIMESHDKE